MNLYRIQAELASGGQPPELTTGPPTFTLTQGIVAMPSQVAWAMFDNPGRRSRTRRGIVDANGANRRKESLFACKDPSEGNHNLRINNEAMLLGYKTTSHRKSDRPSTPSMQRRAEPIEADTIWTTRTQH